ncbi:MAG: hypothetical protein WC144_03755 [Sulfurimonas sp.]|jgi:hypothetical protein|nr:hypothetical protein [Sulfurimonadaceae bacterium]
MQTIKLQLDDGVYRELLSRGIDIQDELKKALHKIVYKKEHKIASDIKKSLDEVKQGKARPLQELLDEL